MINNKNTLLLGIDLGGTKILTSVVNTDGKMLSRDHSITPAAKGHDAVIQAIKESIRNALKEADTSPSDLTAVGIGAPGLSNPATGILYTSPNLPGWKDVPLREILSNELGKATFLINDANAAALGELYYGAGRGLRDFIYVTISTGIGGGIIINREVYSGSIGTAGEIGHMSINYNGNL